MKKRFSAIPTQQFELDTEETEAPEPLQNPPTTPPPLMQRLMPLIMIGMMVLMVYIMSQLGAGIGRNPMMMMMPLMMMPMMMMGMMTGNKNNAASINEEREDYRRQLEEIRKVVWRKGETLHNLLQQMFPSFKLMLSGIGNPTVMAPMWTVDETTGGGYSQSVDSGEINYSPYLSPRVGTGVIKIVPALVPPDVQIEEKIEGVSGWFLKNFMRIVPYVVNAPLGINLDRNRQLSHSAGVSISGAEDKRLGLTRGMICSLAYNHSPEILRIAVISNRADDWDWMKWFPHNGHPAEGDAAGPRRMIYESLSEFSEAMGVVDFANEMAPYFIVVIDMPEAIVKNPMPTIKRMSYIVASAGEDYIATDKANRYSITEKGILTLKGTNMEIRADNVTLQQAEFFARKMSGYGTGFNTIENDEETWDITKSEVIIPPWNEILGVYDIDTFDPRQSWEENKLTMEINIPIGYPVDELTNAPLDPNPVYLDISDYGSGGTGMHGAIVGTTGTGKSFTTKSALVAAAAKYSPEKISFICIDYKGGATFFGFEKLPHTIAIITNLENEKDLLVRSLDMLSGILVDRQNIYNHYRIADLNDYRKQQRNGKLDKDAPLLPDIVVVFDEFIEFITNNPSYKPEISRIARIGRTLGVHLLLVSQALDQSSVGDAMDQITYGIALRLKNAPESRAIIKSDRAPELPSGKGDAFLYKTSPTATLTRYRGYNINEPYKKTAALSTVIENDVDHGDIVGSDIAKFDRHRAAGAAVKITSIVDRWENLIFKEDYEQQQREKKEAEERERKDGTQANVYEAVLEAVSRWKGPDYPKAPMYWTPPLKIPITYSNTEHFMLNYDTSGLYINIGEIDDPFRHQKLPLVLNLSGGDSTTFIAGTPGSGLTTALSSILSSSNMGHPPGFVQTILMDFAGASLYNLHESANTIGACTGQDGDRIKRYVGEVFRLLQYREQVIGANKLNSFEEYLSNKNQEIYQSDPYAHIVILLDDFNRAASIAFGESVNNDPPAWWLYLKEITERGRAVGIHFIATVSQEPTYGHMKGFRGYRVLHLRDGITFATFDGALAFMDQETKMAFKNAAKSIPKDQPGRLVDSTSGLSGRIRIPVDVYPEPYDYDDSGTGIYRQDIDYFEDIKLLNAQTRETIEQTAVGLPHIIETVDSSIAMPILLSQFISMSNSGAYGELNSPERDIRLPYGHTITGIQPLYLKTGDSLLAFGAKGAGKRNLIRDFIYGLYVHANPEVARVIMFDANGELYDEAQILKQKGILAGYAENLGEAKQKIDALQKIITERAKLANSIQLTKEQKIARSWYGEKDKNKYDLYIIVNGLQMFGAPATGYGAGPIQPILEAIQIAGRNDLGITFIGVGTDQVAGKIMDGSVYSALASVGSDVHCLRMSGSLTSSTSVIGKFSLLPEGRGYRFLNGSVTEFQAAYTDPEVLLG